MDVNGFADRLARQVPGESPDEYWARMMNRDNNCRWTLSGGPAHPVPDEVTTPRHSEYRSGPTFFRSGKRWWRDDGHGNQTEATDVGSEEAAQWHREHDAEIACPECTCIGFHTINCSQRRGFDLCGK